MAQEPTSQTQQPQGSNNHIKNIAIVGAGGQVGKHILAALLQKGIFNLTALTRSTSTSTIPSTIRTLQIDYTNPATIISALQNQDCLIITMAITAPPSQSLALIDAAAAAHVPYILPNEYGIDHASSPQLGHDILIGPAKAAERHRVESHGAGGSAWISLITGFWYEWSLSGGPDRFGFDFANKHLTLFDQGTVRLNTTTFPQVGRAVAQLLALRIHPDATDTSDDNDDAGPYLDQYRNRFVHVASFTLNQREMLESVRRVTGTGDPTDDWTVTHVPVRDAYAAGVQALQAGRSDGFVRLLYARMFFPDGAGDYGAARGLENDVLGLPREDLDEYTKIAVETAAQGQFSF